MSAVAAASRVQRALRGHAAIGLLASALLYIIALTGTLIVIHDRWQRWEQPLVVETASLSPQAAQAAMRAAFSAESGGRMTTHFYLRLPNQELPRATATTDGGGHYVDGAGRIVAVDEHGWTEFVIGLHENLQLPAVWGRIAVGALGVALAALALTGVLAHPRIVRDAFRLRARSGSLIARADWHNRLGVWTLPFTLAVALTGAFIGLGSVGFTVLARAYTGGDLERAYQPIFGHEPRPDATPAPLPDIAAALTTLAERAPAVTPTYIVVHAPGTRGQHVQIIASHPRRLVYGESYAFDGSGHWHGPAGLAKGALGQQAAASTYNLHFGNFGGLPIELAYMIFGGALCVVTATGTTIWLRKRRRRGLGGRRLSACWRVITWGTPMLLVWTLWLRAAAGTDAPLAVAFWTVLAVWLALAAARPTWFRAGPLGGMLAISIAVTALVHLLLFAGAPNAVIAIDAVALLGAAGVALVAWLAIATGRARRIGPRRPTPS